MKLRFIGVALIGVMIISGMLPMLAVNAVAWPSLPSTTVQLTVVDGTTSYFKSTLSGVPAGFDVGNGVYQGWCVQYGTTMTRAVSHDVKLYSSLNPPAALALTSAKWVAINYILNHRIGTMMDVQNAIWHFTNGFAVTGNALAMVNAALANPEYDPLSHPIFAVICLRQTTSGVQNTVIELKRALLAGLSPGYWKHNVKVYNGGPGSYSAPYDGMSHETDGTMLGYAGMILAMHGSEIPASIVTADGFLKWVDAKF